MKSGYTHIALVLDRSGSMARVWDDTKGGVEQFIQDHKKAPGECTFTFAAFDEEYTLVEDFTPIKDVNGTVNVSPRGMTRLYDAIGKTIVSVGEKLKALPENERPEKVLIQIQTDGDENDSQDWSGEELNKLIKKQQDEYSWDITFVGANEKCVSDAKKNLGIKVSNTSTYAASNAGGMTRKLSQKAMLYRAAAPEDKEATIAWSAQDVADLNEEA